MKNTETDEEPAPLCRDDTIDHYSAIAPVYLSDISLFVDNSSEDLWNINKQIYNNPELGFEERKAHSLLTGFMRSRAGWKVTASAYGITTAWIASYDSGKRGAVVSFNVEMGTCILSISVITLLINVV